MLQGELLRGHVDSFIRNRWMDERMRSIHHADAFIATHRSTSPPRDEYLRKLGTFVKKNIYKNILEFTLCGFRQDSTKRSTAYTNPRDYFYI